jgi:CRISPR type III-B/RAMP module-associated protein Cmr5
MQNTRDQARAYQAFHRVTAHANKDKSHRDAYSSRAHSFAVFVRVNGLAQTLSFYQAKGDVNNGNAQKWAYGAFYADLQLALNNLDSNPVHPSDLVERVLASTFDVGQYITLTREALAMSVWFKRFSVSILGGEPEQGEG